MVQYNISFAGAGRVAGALCNAMYGAGHNINTIVSEHEKNGRPLADSCKATWSQDLLFPDSTDIIIVAVPDHSVKSALNKIKCGPGTLVVHTAGSLSIDIFPAEIKQKGVFYPLQTFSKGRKILFKDLPFFLEASDEQSTALLTELTGSIGAKPHFADYDHRIMLHIAAIFVCNFTNHMLTIGKELASVAAFPFEVLHPLIMETYSKAVEAGPENSQTGPAIRNDKDTIEKHLELLSFSPEFRRLYFEITRSISKYYQK